LDEPAPDLSTLASYVGTTFNYEPNIAQGNWVALSFAAQLSDAAAAEAGIQVMHVPRQPQQWEGVREVDSEFRLKSGPTEGLTDEFLRDVARAYTAAVARGERPNKEIAKQTKYDVKSAQRWVYLARQRGIMPRGRKGRVG
jgi:hypothetical protein